MRRHIWDVTAPQLVSFGPLLSLFSRFIIHVNVFFSLSLSTSLLFPHGAVEIENNVVVFLVLKQNNTITSFFCRNIFGEEHQ